MKTRNKVIVWITTIFAAIGSVLLSLVYIFQPAKTNVKSKKLDKSRSETKNLVDETKKNLEEIKKERKKDEETYIDNKNDLNRIKSNLLD